MGAWNALRAALLEPTLACQKRQARVGHPRWLGYFNVTSKVARQWTSGLNSTNSSLSSLLT